MVTGQLGSAPVYWHVWQWSSVPLPQILWFFILYMDLEQVLISISLEVNTVYMENVNTLSPMSFLLRSARGGRYVCPALVLFYFLSILHPNGQKSLPLLRNYRTYFSSVSFKFNPSGEPGSARDVPPPLSVHFVSFLCNFWQKILPNKRLVPPWEILNPPLLWKELKAKQQ